MAEVGRRNGVYGGWTRAGNTRVFVRVPTQLKRQSAGHSNGSNGNGSRPELGATPIVLVHGLSSSRTLKPLIKALGTRRPVYAPDLPGFGMSDRPIHPLDVPGLADALRRWMLDNELAPAIVVGVAFGCQVAVHLAAAYPAAVDRLVLIGPTFDPEARSTARVAWRWARNAPRSSPRLAPTIVHDFIDAGPWRSVRTLRRALEDPIEDKLSEIEAKTLVIRAERDHLVPAAWTERVAKQIPDAELVVLPKVAHTIGPRAASRLTALLVPFLVAVSRRDRRGSAGRLQRSAVGPCMEIERHRGLIRFALHLHGGVNRMARGLDPGRPEGLLRHLPGRRRPLGLGPAALQRAPRARFRRLRAGAHRALSAGGGTGWSADWSRPPRSPCSWPGSPTSATTSTTTGHYSTGDNIASLTGLVLYVLVPLALLYLVSETRSGRRPGRPRRARTRRS